MHTALQELDTGLGHRAIDGAAARENSPLPQGQETLGWNQGRHGRVIGPGIQPICYSLWTTQKFQQSTTCRSRSPVAWLAERQCCNTDQSSSTTTFRFSSLLMIRRYLNTYCLLNDAGKSTCPNGNQGPLPQQRQVQERHNLVSTLCISDWPTQQWFQVERRSSPGCESPQLCPSLLCSSLLPQI